MANRQRRLNREQAQVSEKKTDKSIVVLIGAGASFGAGGDMRPSPPPLGDSLFAKLRENYPATWGGLSNSACKYFQDEGFEAGMVNVLSGGYTNACNRMLLDLADYFARFRFGDSPNSSYHQVARSILRTNGSARTVVCSLNYECLFELAAHDVGLTVVYSREGLERPTDLLVLKPHGSCNFLPALNGNRFIDAKFSGPANIALFSGPLTAVRPDQVTQYIAGGQSIPPSMSFYAPGKHTPVGSEVIRKVRDDWASACAAADAIFIIGSRPLRADEHLFGPIVNGRAEVLMVGGRDGGEDFEKFQDKLGSRLDYLADHFALGLPQLKSRLVDLLLAR